jgi:hypothetical protein
MALFLLLYGCEIWSHIEGEHRMRVFENMVTKNIFGPERVEITEELDKLHSKALHNFYPSPNILLIIK